MPLPAKLQLTYTILGVILGSVAVVTIFARGIRSVFRLIKRSNALLDRLQTMLDTWEGRPIVEGGAPQPSFPARVLTLETTVARLEGLAPGTRVTS